MIFISHLQPLQISNKAKFHAFFEKFSHWRLKPDPTQDKFLDFLQNEFSHSKCFQKAFFHLNGGQALCACACPDGYTPHSNEKSFLENVKSENWFCKKSRNLSWVGADWSLKWLKSWKNHEIWLLLKFEAAVDVIKE